MLLTGVLTSGSGEAKKFVHLYSDKFLKILGKKPYPGTLNVVLSSKIKISNFKKIEGFNGYCDVYYIPTKIFGFVNGLIVFPKITYHSTRIIEVVSPTNIRSFFGLEDGDFIFLRLQKE